MEYTPLTEFDTQTETALNYYVAVRDRMIDAVIPLEVELELSDPTAIGYEPKFDLNTQIYDISERISYLNQLLSLHRFAKLDKSQRILLFSGKDVEKIVGTRNYTIRTADTPESIEKNTNISWQKIMEYNDISPLSLTPGQVIIIPYNRTDITAEKLFANNPVFDSHVGSKALGADIENEPTLDLTTDDIKILGHANTFSQGMTSLLSVSPGEVPGYDMFGIDLDIGEDYPIGAKERFIELRVKQGFETDPRVEEVRAVVVEKVSGGYLVTATIKPINSNSFREFIDMIE